MDILIIAATIFAVSQINSFDLDYSDIDYAKCKSIVEYASKTEASCDVTTSEPIYEDFSLIVKKYDEPNLYDGIQVPAQLTSYEMDGSGCDGTVWSDNMLEAACIDKRLCGGTVEFYNTGYSKLDGIVFEIHDTGGAVDYRYDEYSPTGKSYVFDLLRSKALEMLLGEQYQDFIEHGRVKGVQAVVHMPDGCTYVFEDINRAVDIYDNSENYYF